MRVPNVCCIGEGAYGEVTAFKTSKAKPSGSKKTTHVKTESYESMTLANGWKNTSSTSA